MKLKTKVALHKFVTSPALLWIVMWSKILGAKVIVEHQICGNKE